MHYLIASLLLDGLDFHFQVYIRCLNQTDDKSKPKSKQGATGCNSLAPPPILKMNIINIEFIWTFSGKPRTELTVAGSWSMNANHFANRGWILISIKLDTAKRGRLTTPNELKPITYKISYHSTSTMLY